MATIFNQSTRQAAVDTSVLQFVMNDPALCLCPGLFRHLTRADIDLPVELRIAYIHGKVKIRIRGPLLSGMDLAILQATEIVAATAKKVVKPTSQAHGDLIAGLASPSTLDGELLDEAGEPLVLYGADANDDLCFASCSLSHLLRSVNLPVNSHYIRHAADSLERLAGVTLFVSQADAPSRFQTLRLLSHCQVGNNKRTSAVRLALHPRLTSALLGRGKQDTRMCVEEIRALAVNSSARVLHQRLCAIINDGVERSFTVATLTDYLFPEDVSGKALTTLHARNSKNAYDAKVRKLEVVSTALGVLSEKLGWQIFARGAATLAPETVVVITRPERTWTYGKLRATAKQAKAD